MSEMGVPNKVTEVRGNECSPPEVVDVVNSVEESKTEGIDASSSTLDSTLATTTPKKKKKKKKKKKSGYKSLMKSMMKSSSNDAQRRKAHQDRIRKNLGGGSFDKLKKL